MDQPRVVVTDCNFTSFSHEEAACREHGAQFERLNCRTPEEVIDGAKDAAALLVQYAPITGDVLERLSKCEIIVRYGIGVDTIDLNAAEAAGIAICNVPDYGFEEVADHAAALALSLCRQLSYFDRSIREGAWPASTPTPLHSCRDMTFGVVGAGRIGQALVERMKIFGFNCIAYDPFIAPTELAKIGVESCGLDSVIERSDVLSLHLPLTAETRHIIDAGRLAQMKSSAILINTSRGGLIDTHALADALRTGAIAHAGIDVFETEPLAADHPLRSCDNALLSPHMAYYSTASIDRLQRLASEEIGRALAGDPLRCRVV